MGLLDKAFKDVKKAGDKVVEAVKEGGDIVAEAAKDVVETAVEGFEGLSDAGKEVLIKAAEPLAVSYKETNPNPNFDDCVIIVSGLLAANAPALTAVNPMIAAGLTASGSVATARIACRKIFP